MKFAAICQDCDASLRFGSHSDRADWVGKHRVRTGHTVKMEMVE